VLDTLLGCTHNQLTNNGLQTFSLAFLQASYNQHTAFILDGKQLGHPVALGRYQCFFPKRSEIDNIFVSYFFDYI